MLTGWLWQTGSNETSTGRHRRQELKGGGGTVILGNPERLYTLQRAEHNWTLDMGKWQALRHQAARAEAGETPRTSQAMRRQSSNASPHWVGSCSLCDHLSWRYEDWVYLSGHLLGLFKDEQLDTSPLRLGHGSQQPPGTSWPGPCSPKRTGLHCGLGKSRSHPVVC